MGDEPIWAQVERDFGAVAPPHGYGAPRFDADGAAMPKARCAARRRLAGRRLGDLGRLRRIMCGLSLAQGYLPAALAERDEAGLFEVEILGVRRPARHRAGAAVRSDGRGCGAEARPDRAAGRCRRWFVARALHGRLGPERSAAASSRSGTGREGDDGEVHGTPCWYELATSEGSLGAAEAFYGKVLGWTRPGRGHGGFRLPSRDLGRRHGRRAHGHAAGRRRRCRRSG